MLILLFAGNLVAGNGKPIRELLEEHLPGITIRKLEPRDHFSAEFEIMLTQPLDHSNPAAGSFQQLIYLSHCDQKLPVILETEGYWANRYTRELTKILRANQIVVEYRFYGRSVPDSLIWKYLCSDQANEDLHRIVTLFGKIYRGKWVSTGVSKGGEATMIFRSTYPDDVDVSVAYVAPLNLEQEDGRCDEHILRSGDENCRNKLFNFQRMVLENRDSILQYLDEYSKEKGYKYSIGMADALEYATLEFTFSFWQWGGECGDVPVSGTSCRRMFDYLEDIVGFFLYSDEGIRKFEPSFYQHMSELGYYGFITSHLQDLLVAVPEPSNMQFAPQDARIQYNPKYMRRVREYLDREGDRFVYIYGSLDTWTSTGYVPSPLCDAIRCDLPGGDHSTRIADFPAEKQKEIYDCLRRWLRVEIYPLQKL